MSSSESDDSDKVSKKTLRDKKRSKDIKKMDETSSKKSKKNNNNDLQHVINDDGDEMIELGKMRFVTVREFRGMKLIDIREFFTDKSNDKLKPGKKGISLTKEQFENLKKLIPEIEKKISEK